jgi:hypothetical protein
MQKKLQIYVYKLVSWLESVNTIKSVTFFFFLLLHTRRRETQISKPTPHPRMTTSEFAECHSIKVAGLCFFLLQVFPGNISGLKLNIYPKTEDDIWVENFLLIGATSVNDCVSTPQSVSFEVECKTSDLSPLEEPSLMTLLVVEHGLLQLGKRWGFHRCLNFLL